MFSSHLKNAVGTQLNQFETGELCKKLNRYSHAPLLGTKRMTQLPGIDNAKVSAAVTEISQNGMLCTKSSGLTPPQ